MFLDAIDHVQLAMPPGGEQLATWFYDDVLGVPQVPKPPHLAVRGGCWFERGALRIHVGVQDDFVPATKAHPAFAVVDLDRTEAVLRDRGVLARRESDPIGPDVLYVDDPFGNRIELRPGRGPVDEPAERSADIVDVARAVGGERLASQFAFVQELDRLRSVERQSFVLGGLRRENTAEHSWHIAVLAHVLAEYAEEEVDVGRAVLLLLVHDIVEIDAGDVSVHEVDADAKAARELAAADRLFGLLPEDVGSSLRAAWEEYESGDTPEARFARVFDRMAPFLMNLGADGMPWRRGGVTAVQARRAQRPVAEGAPVLGRFVDALIERAVREGMLPSGESGIILPGPGDAL